eukprot:TRINITY_DN59_c0_g3_i1.p1 TRINITY_DN59_c0_g3~~TRINITY_DN59_c0_g3_i1.p1  ORF type:complete len:1605 (+),score=215.77 TRINITY_DN59_c0_g3_i1:8435-13249(+)
MQITTSSQSLEPQPFWTLSVHLPPFLFFSSSHIGFTPSTNYALYCSDEQDCNRSQRGDRQDAQDADKWPRNLQQYRRCRFSLSRLRSFVIQPRLWLTKKYRFGLASSQRVRQQFEMSTLICVLIDYEEQDVQSIYQTSIYTVAIMHGNKGSQFENAVECVELMQYNSNIQKLMRTQRNGGLKMRSETQAGPVISIPTTSRARNAASSHNKPSLNPPQTTKNPKILGRRIENEGLLDIAKEDDLPSKPQVVFVSRSRSRSTDLNARKTGLGTVAIIPRKPTLEHAESTRNLLKSRKSLASFKDLLQRLESIKPSPTLPTHDNKDLDKHKHEAEDKRNLDFSISSLSHISGGAAKNPETRKLRVLSPEAAQQSSHLEMPYTRVNQKRRSVESMPVSRPTGKTSRKGSAEIDGLIKDNLRRKKLQDEMQKLENFEKQERERIAKEILNEKNRQIREMNAKATRTKKRNRSQEDIPGKIPWGADQRKMRPGYISTKVFMGFTANQQKPHQKEKVDPEKRVSMLGLDIVYMKGGGSVRRSCETISENRNRANIERIKRKDEKVKIRNYINQKKGEWVKKRKDKENQERYIKEKIDENKMKLNEMIRSMFKTTKKNAVPEKKPIKHKKKASKGRIKKKSAEENKYNEYRKILAGVQREEERVRNMSGMDRREDNKTKNELMMEKIKEQLIKEMSCHNKIDKPSDTSQSKPSTNSRMMKSQSQPRLADSSSLSEKMSALTSRYQALKQKEPSTERAKFQNEGIVAALKATKIQAVFRGYLARKRIAEYLERAALDIPSEEYFEEKSMPKEQSEINLQEIESENEKVVHLSRINAIEEDLKDNIETKPQSRPDDKPSEAVVKSETKETGIITDPLLPVAPPVEPAKPCAHIAINTEEEKIEPSPEKNEPKAQIPLAITVHPIESICTVAKKPLVIDTNLEEEEDKIELPAKPEPESTRSLGRFGKKFLVTESDKSEGAPNDSLDLIIEKELSANTPKSIFDRNTFQLFTLKKFGDQLNGDNLSKVLAMREKVISYREKTEKKYLSKMYKNKQYSPRTYQSKRKELEKWVTKEREEIRKTKSGILDSWRKTAEMIEEAHTNALHIKKFFLQHALSYNSDTNSTISLAIDTHQEHDLEDLKVPDQDRPSLTGAEPEETVKPSAAIFIQENISSPSTTKHVTPPATELPAEIPKESTIGSPESGATLKHSVDEEVAAEANDAEIEWQSELSQKQDVERRLSEEEVKEGPVKIVKEKVEDPEEITIPDIKPELQVKEEVPAELPAESNPPLVIELPPQPPVEEPDTKPEVIETLTSDIYSEVLNDIFKSLFPIRDTSTKPSQLSPTAQVQSLLKSLAIAKKKGIQTNIYQVNDYLNELLDEVLFTQREQFMSSTNQSITQDPLDVLGKLQSPDQEQRMQLMQPSMQQPPHELCPVLQLDTYLELEKKKELSKNEDTSKEEEESQQLIEECEHIHNKAIFDAVNEALNLIRPYGMHGQPMPWSTIPRVLFTKIAEPSIIIRNIKNIVLDWASFEAGTLPQLAFMMGDRFDEEYFSEVREKKLIALLAQEVLDSEDQWVNYEMEEAEVKIDLADMIMDQLVTEAAEMLVKLGKDNKSK